MGLFVLCSGELCLRAAGSCTVAALHAAGVVQLLCYVRRELYRCYVTCGGSHAAVSLGSSKSVIACAVDRRDGEAASSASRRFCSFQPSRSHSFAALSRFLRESRAPAAWLPPLSSALNLRESRALAAWLPPLSSALILQESCILDAWLPPLPADYGLDCFGYAGGGICGCHCNI